MQEIELSNALAVLLTQSRDDPSGELARIVACNHELAQRSGDLVALVTQRTYACVAAFTGGEWTRAASLPQQLAKLARGDGGTSADPSRIGVMMARAMEHFCRFMIAYHWADLCAAEDHYRSWEQLQDNAEWPQYGAAPLMFGDGAQLAAFTGQTALADYRTARGRDFVQHELSAHGLAEADFHEAVALAEPMGAITFQLRAINGLTRLAPTPDHANRLAAMLARFADADKLCDVVEARALIAGIALE